MEAVDKLQKKHLMWLQAGAAFSLLLLALMIVKIRSGLFSIDHEIIRLLPIGLAFCLSPHLVRYWNQYFKKNVSEHLFFSGVFVGSVALFVALTLFPVSEYLKYIFYLISAVVCISFLKEFLSFLDQIQVSTRDAVQKFGFFIILICAGYLLLSYQYKFQIIGFIVDGIKSNFQASFASNFLLIFFGIYLGVRFFQKKSSNYGDMVWIVFFLFSILIVYLSTHYFQYDGIFSYEFNSVGARHRDSIFHQALINSIVDKGYPSTVQDGYVVIFYHVLSHYFLAGIMKVFGVNSEVFLFLSRTIIVFPIFITSIGFALIHVSKEVREKIKIELNSVDFFAMFIILFHFMFQYENIVCSIGCIVASISLILALPMILEKLWNPNDPVLENNYLLICILIGMAILSKISTGYAMICILFPIIFFSKLSWTKKLSGLLSLSALLILQYIFFKLDLKYENEVVQKSFTKSLDVFQFIPIKLLAALFLVGYTSYKPKNIWHKKYLTYSLYLIFVCMFPVFFVVQEMPDRYYILLGFNIFSNFIIFGVLVKSAFLFFHDKKIIINGKIIYCLLIIACIGLKITFSEIDKNMRKVANEADYLLKRIEHQKTKKNKIRELLVDNLQDPNEIRVLKIINRYGDAGVFFTPNQMDEIYKNKFRTFLNKLKRERKSSGSKVAVVIKDDFHLVKHLYPFASKEYLGMYIYAYSRIPVLWGAPSDLESDRYGWSVYPETSQKKNIPSDIHEVCSKVLDKGFDRVIMLDKNFVDIQSMEAIPCKS